ncbi:MAG: long-chain fatty acid--CoA ligase [Acidobacteria bacterium]|nr:long-chain fatty acid--CoA ligase [Acidobacteriota bacterium]
MAPAVPTSQRTIYRLLKQSEATWGAAPALHQPNGDGTYRTYSFIDYRRHAEEAAAGLRSLGIHKGDIVGLASETRAEFYLADLGIMVNGSISAAVYTSLPPAEQVKTLKACNPKAIFVENPKTLKSLLAAGLSGFPVQLFLLSGEAPGATTFQSILDAGRRAIAADPALLPQIESEVLPHDYGILYLTSGATGEPKMGLVTHNAMLANCECGPPALPVGNNDCILAFLPSAHITQRLIVEILMLRMGVQVFFSEGLSKMPIELRSVRPTFFVAPPRVWERVYSSITTEIRKKPAFVRRLFYMGLGVGSEAARARQQGRNPSPWIQSSLKFFDAVVFSKIRQRLGGRLRIAASGSAPLGTDLADFYASIGLPLVEGYGLTEGGVVCLNPIGNPRPGSIGKPLVGADLRLDSDGELLIRGEMIFSGYYQDADSTAVVLRDGWLHTGDLAEFDEDGFLYITGRKKELIVSSAGKKIYPSRIEVLFKLEPLVNQILLIGDRMPYVTALVTISPQAAEQLPGVRAGLSLAELSQHPAVLEEVKRIVQKVNRQLASFEQIRRYKILDREFTMDAGEITPTMKLRRGKVLDNFRTEIGELYQGPEDYA